LRITLETGRKHQIRAHMAQRNHPILGDTVYGGPPAPRLMLAAVELRLRHPADDRPLVFTIDPPSEFAKYAAPATK
jgi:23S rRNA-/tRNA-specific pseudouridylate synthase